MIKSILLLMLFPLCASASFQIFGVRTDFSMSESDPRYRDVYVNLGTDQGVKVGSQLDVFRVLTTVDEINQKTGRNISFKFAKLKVIHADSDISVARVVQINEPDSTPIGAYTNVMVGDMVDVAKK